jgi:carboxypeptidase Taq
LIKKVCSTIAEKSFFDKNKATYSEVIHPECIGVGPEDIRITTYFNDLIPSIFSMLHECGHGVYSYSSNEKVVDYGIWGGIHGAMHESQSRFYENLIGKSKEFWQYFYPLLQDEIKEFQNIDLDTFYNGINKVNISAKRLEADELTYSLHPIIRFEIEKEYFEGKLKTDDFYEAWNAKYKEYLGIEPQNDREGILQDIHWAAGLIGYFQSYTLGNIYGGQLRNKMLQDIPDLYQQIANGNFVALNKWNYEKIHQYGKLYSPNELIMKVTGEEIQSKYFVEYLNKKFL